MFNLAFPSSGFWVQNRSQNSPFESYDTIVFFAHEAVKLEGAERGWNL